MAEYCHTAPFAPESLPMKEAVHLDHLPWSVNLQVPLGERLPGSGLGGGVAGHQPQPLGPGVQPVPPQNLVDPVG